MADIKDSDIMTALSEDTERGFRLLLSKYKQAVYWHIRRLVVSHDDAQDATQDTFVRVFRSFGQFRGKDAAEVQRRPAVFVAWIYRIATNEALRILRRRHEGQLSLEAAGTEGSRLAAESYVDYTDLEAVKLQRAILSLPTRQQLAFNLRYYDELKYDEIAEVMESSVAAAKMNYHLAKEKIVKYMKSTTE